MSNGSVRYQHQPQSFPPISPAFSNRSVAVIETPPPRTEKIKCQECHAGVSPENFKKHMDDHELLKKTQIELVELKEAS